MIGAIVPRRYGRFVGFAAAAAALCPQSPRADACPLCNSPFHENGDGNENLHPYQPSAFALAWALHDGTSPSMPMPHIPSPLLPKPGLRAVNGNTRDTLDGKHNRTALRRIAVPSPLSSSSDRVDYALSRLDNSSAALEALHRRREDFASQVVTHLAGSDEFTAMLQRNIAPFRRLMTYYECAMMEMETKFRVLDAHYGLQHDRNPIESIKTRLKSTDSLAKKLTRKGFPVTVESVEQNIFDVAYGLQHDRNPIESIKTRLKSTDSLAKKLTRKGFPVTVESVEQNIFDVAGVRVVCTFPEDIFTLADALLAQDDVTLVERRDYVANPKESGYRSLHLIVEIPIFLEHEKRLIKVEVQLRTIAMNFWASLEHQLRYKKNLPEAEAAAVAEELAELAEAAADLDARMQALRNFLDEEHG